MVTYRKQALLLFKSICVMPNLTFVIFRFTFVVFSIHHHLRFVKHIFTILCKIVIVSNIILLIC